MAAYEVEAISFLRKHELSKLFKNIDKNTESAVKLLVETMNSLDKEVTLKTKLDCAKILLDLQVKVGETIAKDQLVRQVAELKKNGANGKLVPIDGEGKKQEPMLNFYDIQEID